MHSVLINRPGLSVERKFGIRELQNYLKIETHDSETVLHIKHKKSHGFQCYKNEITLQNQGLCLRTKIKGVNCNNDLIIQIHAKVLLQKKANNYRFVWLQSLELIYEPDTAN